MMSGKIGTSHQKAMGKQGNFYKVSWKHIADTTIPMQNFVKLF